MFYFSFLLLSLSDSFFFGSALVRMIWDVARYLSLQLEDWNVIMGMDKMDGLERLILRNELDNIQKKLQTEFWEFINWNFHSHCFTFGVFDLLVDCCQFDALNIRLQAFYSTYETLEKVKSLITPATDCLTQSHCRALGLTLSQLVNLFLSSGVLQQFRYNFTDTTKNKAKRTFSSFFHFLFWNNPD